MGCGLVDNSPFLRVAHNAHSPDDGVGTFSIIKWVLFQLSRFRRNSPSGHFFDCQMGTFSVDKHMSPTRASTSSGVQTKNLPSSPSLSASWVL
jgi:hypothetical protein